MTVNSGGHFDLLAGCLQLRDYREVARLLQLPNGKRPAHPSLQTIQVEPRVKGLVAPYDLVTESFYQLQDPLASLEAKHKAALESLQTFLKYFAGKEGNEEVPVLKGLCENAYLVSSHIDRLPVLTGGRAEHLEELARLLPRCFTACLTDRSPLASSKKWATLRIIVILFKVYFRLNTLRLCGNIIRALEQAQDFPDLRAFPKSETISYWYYRARLAIHQKEFKAAEGMLSDALGLCHPEDLAHKRELLTYLVPLKVMHGVLPQPALLARYNLTQEYGELTQAVRTGNLALFDSILTTNQAFFMHKELFLIIQLHLKNLILRNLFRRIYLVALKEPGGQESRLQLGSLEAGLAVFGIQQVGRDVVECWLANLINEGYIRGYISHDKGTLVLSKKNPFPAPSTLH